MTASVAKLDVWAGAIEDRPGGLAEKLGAVAEAGADLEFLIARRAPDKPGTGVVFLAPLKGGAQIGAARKAGLAKADGMHSVRVEVPNKAGLAAKMVGALAAAGINLRGTSAAALGRKSVAYFAFDTKEDATKAVQVLRKLLSAGK